MSLICPVKDRPKLISVVLRFPGLCCWQRHVHRCSQVLQVLHLDSSVVFAGQYVSASSEAQGDIFYFDYGVVAFWGLEKPQASHVKQYVHDFQDPVLKLKTSKCLHLQNIASSTQVET